jgi:hypothetical protein
MLVSALSIALLSLATVNAAVLPITRTGKYLFDSTGARFYIKGVAYQRPTTAAAETAESIANGGFPVSSPIPSYSLWRRLTLHFNSARNLIRTSILFRIPQHVLVTSQT